MHGLTTMLMGWILAPLGLALQPSPAPETTAAKAETALVELESWRSASPEDCLANFSSGVPQGTAARDMTLEQARDVVVELHRDGLVTLRSGFEPKFREDDEGNCTLIAPAAAKMPIGSKVAGIPFKILEGSGAVESYMSDVDPRLVVGLVRFTEMLKSKWNATAILHTGIHVEGRGFDFFCAVLPDGDAEQRVCVLEDWGRRKVPKSAGSSEVSESTDWPTTTSNTSYRLNVSGSSNDNAQFFLDVYNLFVAEFYDVDECGSRSEIGQGSHIMTPDHPTSKPGTKNGREAHKNHVHAEMPPTGWKCTELEYE